MAWHSFNSGECYKLGQFFEEHSSLQSVVFQFVKHSNSTSKGKVPNHLDYT